MQSHSHNGSQSHSQQYPNQGGMEEQMFGSPYQQGQNGGIPQGYMTSDGQLVQMGAQQGATRYDGYGRPIQMEYQAPLTHEQQKGYYLAPAQTGVPGTNSATQAQQAQTDEI